jgi:hypothetical protein
MSIGAIIAIVIVVLLVAAAAVLVATQMRRRALHDRFGPEYKRLAAEVGPRRAEAELAARQRRIKELDIHPLTQEQRAQYAIQWTAVQERFVDDPVGAVEQAGTLVSAVQKDRGYPAGDLDEEMANLSVNHASAVSGYREAQEVTQKASSASTDDLRQAVIQYRTLFRELIGPAADGSATAPALPRSPASATTKE